MSQEKKFHSTLSICFFTENIIQYSSYIICSLYVKYKILTHQLFSKQCGSFITFHTKLTTKIRYSTCERDCVWNNMQSNTKGDGRLVNSRMNYERDKSLFRRQVRSQVRLESLWIFVGQPRILRSNEAAKWPGNEPRVVKWFREILCRVWDRRTDALAMNWNRWLESR